MLKLGFRRASPVDSEHMHPLATVIVILALPLALRWLSRSRAMAAEREAGVLVLQYGRPWRVAAAIGAAVFVAIPALVLLVVPVEPLRLRSLLGTIVFFGILLIPACLETFGVRHRLRPDGLTIDSPWRRQRQVRWEDIEAVGWSPTWYSYVLCLRGGGKLRLFYGLSGLGDFARLLLSRTPSSALIADAAANARLRAARRSLTRADRTSRE